MHRRAGLVPMLALALVTSTAVSAGAQFARRGPAITIGRASSAIVIDGDLTDPAWRTATRIDRWYETSPGDNIEPPVRSVGYLAYDDRYLYAGFEFDDPDPSTVRAPYGDHDSINSSVDYGGVILDTRNDGHTGVLLLANPHNVQYDSVSDDNGAGEDSSPDFFWESVSRISSHGWTLEMRVPFSSLRYRSVEPRIWGIMLFRNYPRDYRHQIFSTTIPRGNNCFICNANTLLGLEHLPDRQHTVVAPYVSGAAQSVPIAGVGTPLSPTMTGHAGVDVKWMPDADNALDATVRPDFSQVESDTAQISANERFALFYPEKRPFFLEGIELFSTPFQAVYTRTITSPDWGARMTGKNRGVGYTVLVAGDQGGGSAILPGPNGSSLANDDIASRVAIARVRRDIGASFVGALVTEREAGADGHNRVAGPDVLWRPTGADTITAQWLYSTTRTPNRPDLAAEWTGQPLAGHAAQAQWNRNTRHFDANGQYKDVGDGFRTEVGFVPQVGYRDTYGETGWTFRPHGFLTRLRTFFIADRQIDRSGRLISREWSPGAGMDTFWSGFMRFRYADDRIAASGRVLPRRQFVYTVKLSPARWLTQLGVDGSAGPDIDFDQAQPATGLTANLTATVSPTSHVRIDLLDAERRLNVRGGASDGRRLVTATIRRVQSTYAFTERTFARLIIQDVDTRRDPLLYVTPTTAHDRSVNASALLAYKVNWQSVIFVGYGDGRALSPSSLLAPSGRQVFLKISHAFRR